MDIETAVSLLQGPLALVGMFYPPAAPAIAIIKAAAPAIVAAAPAIKQAVADGESAFEAAKTASPDFAHAVSNLMAHYAPSAVASAPLHQENITRVLGGAGQMTSAEEQAWMDRFTPSDDSRSGSG